MSSVSKRKKEGSRGKIKTMGDHQEFLKRITKTLYYGQLPALPCLSLPVTEVSCEVWSVAQRGRSLRRLHADAAAATTRSACVSPCALVLAILYVERLKRSNPDYLAAAPPEQLFLVSLMVSNKFLQDDGEDDEVVCSEWATSGGLTLDQLKRLEVEFLNAIDWKVYVSERSFEAGLSWLERQVALRQARARGFFTYCDLACSADGALAADVARALAAAARILGLAYVALLTSTLLLTQTLLLAQALLPAHTTKSQTASLLDTSTLPDNVQMDLPILVSNGTLDLDTKLLAEKFVNNLRCCRKWQRYVEENELKRQQYEATPWNDRGATEPWWPRTLVLNWLYRSSLINPMQRWLEKMTQYADFFKLDELSKLPGQCGRSKRRQCAGDWLNFSKLGVYATAMSDR